MYAQGHYGIGMLLSTPIVGTLLLFDAVLISFVFTTWVIVTVTLPDIDLKQPFSQWVRHRGITHTVWFAILTGIIATIITGLVGILFNSIINFPLIYALVGSFFGGFLGVTFHLVGDVITPTGINPFQPYGSKIRYHITTAKGIWWFEELHGSQTDMNAKESLRHSILNSNRIFFTLGSISLLLTIGTTLML